MRRVGRPSNVRASSIPIAASPDLIPIVVAVGGGGAAVDLMVIAVVAAGKRFVNINGLSFRLIFTITVNRNVNRGIRIS